MEGDLRETMAMLERAQRIRGVGYWTLDIAKQELCWSPQTRRIYAGDADFDVTYESAQKLVHPDDLSRMNAEVEKALTRKEPVQIEHRIIRPDGSAGIVNVDIEVDRDAEGHPIRMFGTILDVTAQRQAEAALRESSEKLLDLDRLKDQFLANTSHELKTPLNAIIGIAESLGEGVSGKLSLEQKEQLAMISISARRLSNLINDILDVSQLKNGDIKLNKRGLRLQDLVRQMMVVFEHLNQKKGILFRWHVPENLPPVWGDEDRIKQIFYNLLDNALKFTERGEITTSLWVEEDLVKITVADTGRGIAKDKYEDIFKSFYQIEGPCTRSYSGTGLGLSITKHLVELHGGKISVVSEESKGARFCFSLPIYKGRIRKEDGEITGIIPRFHPKLVWSKPPENLTWKADEILIVDDDDASIQAVMSVLKREGYSIAVAHHGKQALEMIQANPNLCLVILDLVLPGLLGYEVCRIIRQTKDRYILPVLMLTGRNYTDSILMGFDSGANDFLAKPFEPGELRARVRTLVELKKSVERAIKTEIKFLHSQIRPHFIHNALHTIISISRKDSERARLLLVEFSNYLRGCFDFTNLEDSVPMEKEISLVQSYIAIEQARWGRKLHVQYHIENVSINVPPLIVQPIVENAVIHGLRPKPEGGTIILSVTEKEKSIIIDIRDNGIGMSEEKLRSLLNGDMAQEGVGLRNINQRLKKLYGKTLSIKSEAGKGTTVLIEIPLMEADHDFRSVGR
ncbi:ATP-binding protein [Candidatus Formimonas warabiya]|nr:ATP-binding protein [Candidatus Formimonas warabiya]